MCFFPFLFKAVFLLILEEHFQYVIEAPQFFIQFWASRRGCLASYQALVLQDGRQHRCFPNWPWAMDLNLFAALIIHHAICSVRMSLCSTHSMQSRGDTYRYKSIRIVLVFMIFISIRNSPTESFMLTPSIVTYD